MSLAEFLLARIAEDEDRIGDSAAPPRTWSETFIDSEAAKLGRPIPAASPVVKPLAQARVECDAKRRLVEWAAAASAPEYQGYVLPLLALPYADHPDYQPEWRV
jgi:hypothetical protein